MNAGDTRENLPLTLETFQDLRAFQISRLLSIICREVIAETKNFYVSWEGKQRKKETRQDLQFKMKQEEE